MAFLFVRFTFFFASELFEELLSVGDPTGVQVRKAFGDLVPQRWIEDVKLLHRR
jgi:hypothetical protein